MIKKYLYIILFNLQNTVDYAEKKKYKNIYLARHSLGANKIIYYLSRNNDKRVKKYNSNFFFIPLTLFPPLFLLGLSSGLGKGFFNIG